jgi:hypothetical protein
MKVGVINGHRKIGGMRIISGPKVLGEDMTRY